MILSKMKDCFEKHFKYFLVRLLVFFVLSKSMTAEENSCLTGSFIDVQDWALKDGSLSPQINGSGYGLDLSNQPDAITELRLLLLRFASEDVEIPVVFNTTQSSKSFKKNTVEVMPKAHTLLHNMTIMGDIGEIVLNRIIYLSLARNNLDRIPLFYTDPVGKQSSNWQKLKYLSLYGNIFSDDLSKSTTTSTGVEVAFNATQYEEINPRHYFTYSYGMSNWAKDLSSLKLINLLELDLRNCSIQTLHDNTFDSMPELRKLYLSHNTIHTVYSSAFSGLNNLVHLDMSVNFVKIVSTNETGLIDGMTILPDAFEPLRSLKSLDFSHTKIVQTCAAVFQKMSSTMERLSLCNTKFPYITNRMFKNTSMKYLDISGNMALEFIETNAFSGTEDTLEILYVNNLSIKQMTPFRNLVKLKVLSLVGNDIADFYKKDFEHLENLEIVDLSSNRITVWTEEVFGHLKHLELLNLRDNNLNLLSPEIMKEFSNLKYLSMGRNSFVCNCIAKDFIDTARNNHQAFEQSPDSEKYPDWFVNTTSKNCSSNDILERYSDQYFINISERIVFHNAYISYSNMISESKDNFGTPHFPNIVPYRGYERKKEIEISDDINFASNFTFQLLDYTEDDYSCIDSKSNKALTFINIDCVIREKDHIKQTSTLVIILISTGILVAVTGLIIWKWWSVRYFFLMLKNIAILSIMGKEAHTEDCNKLFVYDVFASYCDEDRQWILDELLPQIESHPKISACLHERDFQVGITILENIISCMDRSRVLLMVVSNNFLMSHWCQFEMHLAQHRLLETMREQLILVLLEDIPRRKRPNTLHYLMMTKTYIVWPKDEKDRPAFWKRLKQSILNGRALESSSIA